MSRIITLTTDFGTRDGYVAAMKGVILGINPRTIIVDISHGIEQQNIAQAAFVLGTTYQSFPPDTIHVAAVDPGVGTGRKAVVVETGAGLFVGPDNGVFSYVLEAWPKHRTFALTNQKLWRKPVSCRFHGRDIFAPAAAYLSKGVNPQDFGEALDSLFSIHIPRPERNGGTLLGEIINVDTFGNLISNFREADLPSTPFGIEIGGRTISGLSKSYAEGGKLLAIIGSSGYLEISTRNANAASELHARLGQHIMLHIA